LTTIGVTLVVYIVGKMMQTQSRKGDHAMEGTINWKSEVFDRLNPSQRIELAMELWDSVVAENKQLLLSDDDRQEIRRRVTELDRGRMQSHPWHDVKQRMLRDTP
jgi:putative addiction module component (TIGR02574 family)